MVVGGRRLSSRSLSYQDRGRLSISIDTVWREKNKRFHKIIKTSIISHKKQTLRFFFFFVGVQMFHYLSVSWKQWFPQNGMSVQWAVTTAAWWWSMGTFGSFILGALSDLPDAYLSYEEDFSAALHFPQSHGSFIGTAVMHHPVSVIVFHNRLKYERKIVKQMKVNFAFLKHVCKTVTWTEMTHPKDENMLSRSLAVTAWSEFR